MILFSIIIPTFNRPSTLQLCLQSVLELEYPKDSFEVIVVDDGSTISVNEVVEPFERKMKLRVFRQQNSGPAAARNRGAELASGEHLAFTDDDCQVSTLWLKSLETAVGIHPDSAIAGPTINLIHNPYCEASQEILEVLYSLFEQRPNHPLRFYASSNLCFPRSAFLRLGGFDPRFRTSEDREICARWRDDGKALVFRNDAAVFHRHQLAFGSFVAQHFRYGEGAKSYHQKRKSLGSSSSMGPDPHYYRLLFQSPPRQPVASRLQHLSLLVLSQIASSVGFLLHRVAE
jgi:glycosyltransferase involved in cell wall biosynthesis